MDTNALAARYGVDQTNGLEDGQAYHAEVIHDDISLAEVAKRGGRITRVRVLAEVRSGLGWVCDISYIHATLADGSTHSVRMSGRHGHLLRKLKGDFIEWAKEEGVYAKGLGLLDEGNWSVLR